ncbi:MAG: tetratricopeptide repeat protein [bacterium]
MKKLCSILILLVLLTSCSRENFDSLIEKKRYDEAFEMAKEGYVSTKDLSFLKDALLTANEYLEDAKIALPILENHFKSFKNYDSIEDLAALTYYNSALSFYRTNKYDSAVILAEKAFSIKPNYAKAVLLIGKSKVRSGDLKQGYLDIERAVFADSTLSDGYTFMANMRLIEGKNDEAEELYRRAVKINPNYYEGWMNLGEFLGATKRGKESKDCYRSALLIDSSRIDAYDRLISIFTSEDRMDSVLKYMDKYQKITGINLRVK